MIKRLRSINKEEGMALVIALVMLLALTVLGISAITTSNIDVMMSRNERMSFEALHLADAGIERALLDLMTDFKKDKKNWGNDIFWVPSTGVITGALTNITLPTTAVGSFPPTAGMWGNPFGSANLAGSIGNAVDPYGVQTLGNGKFRVLILRAMGYKTEVYLRSYAETAGGIRKIIEMHLRVDDTDVWKNAIFAGKGSSSASITGNITVAGSVHILGTGDTSTWSVSGSSKVINGYQGMAASARNLITDVEMVNVAGTMVETLNATLRAKKGNIALSGVSQDRLGQNDASQNCVAATGICDDGNGHFYKGKLDAIYTNNPISGITANNVYADKMKTTNGYDLGDKMQMPAFNDPYDPNSQFDLTGAVCGTCSTYKQYVQTMSTPITQCTFNTDTTANYSAGISNCTDAADLRTCSCTDPNGCIRWVQAPGAGKPNLWTEGKLNAEGCAGPLNIGTTGAGITYVGKGAFYTDKQVNIDQSLQSTAKNVDNSNRYFGVDDMLGVMTESDIQFATSTTASSYMGMFFSAAKIKADKTSAVIGSVVSNIFCLGGTNPDGSCKTAGGGTGMSVYYVKQVSDAASELGMIKGSSASFTFSDYSWREVYE